MTLLERKVDAIARALMANNMAEHNAALADLRELMGKTQESWQDVEETVRAALTDLGIPEHILGHRYLVFALKMVIAEPDALKAMTKEVYYDTAKEFGTTWTRVERAMRHAIEVGFERTPDRVLVSYFGNTVSLTRGNPTNKEFLARVSNVIRARMKGAV